MNGLKIAQENVKGPKFLENIVLVYTVLYCTVLLKGLSPKMEGNDRDI
jgi:hypothetical protein